MNVRGANASRERCWCTEGDLMMMLVLEFVVVWWRLCDCVFVCVWQICWWWWSVVFACVYTNINYYIRYWRAYTHHPSNFPPTNGLHCTMYACTKCSVVCIAQMCVDLWQYEIMHLPLIIIVRIMCVRSWIQMCEGCSANWTHTRVMYKLLYTLRHVDVQISYNFNTNTRQCDGFHYVSYIPIICFIFFVQHHCSLPTEYVAH